jgi:D-alanine-D-alanine ligase
MSYKKRVAIICGGPSSEHEISCISASGILGALDSSLYEPVLIGITKEGKWLHLPIDYSLSMRVVHGEHVLPVIKGNYPEVTNNLDIEIAFPVLHGAYGEDGQIQQELEARQIPYVGSGVNASHVAMDKDLSKQAFASSGIAVAPGIVVQKSDWNGDLTDILSRVQKLGLPLFVKSARGGSSRGTVKVKEVNQLAAALDEAFIYDDKALIESAIVGAEVECAVIERDGEIFASIPGRVWIDPRFDFYDFEAKYLDGATRIDIPAPFDPAVIAALRAHAARAFKAIGCRGLARVDFFITPTNEIIINEINTMPGMTPMSAYPKMLAASGISFKRALNYLLSAAIN